MSKAPKQVAEFLSKKRIAVAGVSRNFQQPANAIYWKLKSAGYQVYAINPNAERVDGDICFPDLHSVPGRVEAVMIVTHPDMAAKVVRECADLGIRHVWLRRSFGQAKLTFVSPSSLDKFRAVCERLGRRIPVVILRDVVRSNGFVRFEDWSSAGRLWPADALDAWSSRQIHRPAVRLRRRLRRHNLRSDSTG